MENLKSIVNCSSRGQITLPSSWRKKFAKSQFLLKSDGKKLTLTPIDIDEIETEWETLFDAKTMNNGKPLSAEKMIKEIKKSMK